MEQENKCYGCLLGKIFDFPKDGNVTITKHASTDSPAQNGAGVVFNVYVVRNYSVINKTSVPDDLDASVDNTARRDKNFTIYGDVTNESI